VPRSLASRLIIGSVVLSAVLVAVPGGLACVRVRDDLTSRLDDQLAATGRGSLDQVFRNIQERAPTPQVLWLTQLDGDGKVLDLLPADGPIRHMSLSVADRARLASPQPSPITIRTTDGQTLRVMSEPQPQLVGTIVVGLSTDSVQGPLHHLLLLELLLAVGAVGVAAVAAVGIRYSLRPLRRLTSTARLVARDLSTHGAGLGRRAPLHPAQANTEAGELTQAFNTLLDEVETQFAARTASEQRMRQFLADASHELRTPLTSIRGYAELEGLRQRRTGNSTTNDALARIEAEGNKMARLVEDLLTLARGDQGRPLTTEPVDLSSLSSDAIDSTSAAYPERDIHTMVEPGLATLGDDAALLRAVRNVLANAAIHTNQAGSIRLNAYRDQNQAVISIADDGPGMTPEQAQHAFERFWRADDSRVRATGGNGLGLAIVESIVTAHDGTIDLQTSVATGTTITIRLPLTTRPETA
jgi:two-component system OmpR family sensor kinase